MIELNKWYKILDIDMQKKFIKDFIKQIPKDNQLIVSKNYDTTHYAYVMVELYNNSDATYILRYIQYDTPELLNENIEVYNAND